MSRTESPGQLVAAALAGSWRKSFPKSTMTASDAATIVPLLLRSGAGALGWWRFRNSDGQLLSAVRALRKTYLQYAIHAAEHECKLTEVFQVLRSAGVEPILLKGWAVARAYPEIGLRPSGDIDLSVSPDQHGKALAVLNTPEYQRYWVDLDHDEITRFNELSFEDLYRGSELVNLDGTEVRVLGAEDHLRILCLHLLKHGAWRPLWLCDVAAALEARSANFDWHRCLGENKRHANWVLCTLGLASSILGAAIGDTPAMQRVSSLPGWLTQTVLKQWSTSCAPNLPLFVDQLRESWWKPSILEAIRKRWPNSIQATIDVDGEFNDMIRLPFQLRNCIARSAKLCRQLVSAW
jgi:hypothetical protein